MLNRYSFVLVVTKWDCPYLEENIVYHHFISYIDSGKIGLISLLIPTSQ
jgi:hypothetical protein